MSDTREAILTAASELYATRGYDAVSMRDVATAVGVTPANLYYHFKDKEALIISTLSYVFANRTAQIIPMLTNADSPKEEFCIFISWFIRLVFADKIFTRLLIRELLDGNNARLEYLSKTVFDELFSLLSQIITAYPGSSEPASSAMTVVATVLGHYQLAGVLPHLPGGRAEYSEPDVLIRHLTEVLGGQ